MRAGLGGMKMAIAKSTANWTHDTKGKAIRIKVVLEIGSKTQNNAALKNPKEMKNG